ncbi:chemotaxis protein CheW [Pelagicoccus mobilis]|uniref:Chemotaxis protein CheW n=1 Tax=Pelagicoccus mobilis TaxID=415221 RepID=A0A934S0F0_9BACT|nr:chemotaxis protein CheW [Pelagicoccus mobilis]MBK1878266.1 chemotaxis protein CheW [Pelagicoccus mobilis]
MKQFCTFYLGDLMLGVDVLEVQEVILYQDMTQVPLAHDSIKGLINLRGQIVTAIDLRERLNLPPSTSEEEQKNIVIQSGEEAVSLLVDEIGDVIEPSEDDFEDPPETIPEAAKEMIEGVYKLDKRLLLVLNSERTINITSDTSSNWLQTAAS